MPQPSVAEHILLNAPAGMLSWIYSYKVQNAPGRLDIFWTCHGVAGCPSKAGQTLSLQCPSSEVAGYILLRISRVPQPLVELDILQIVECPIFQGLDILFIAPARMVSWTHSIRCRMPQDLWTYSIPVMARQSTPAKLNRPYA